jgi:UDP-N-acetyl-D-mannosaminuronic acid dehydrogenase
MNNICFIGLGYVGLPTAAILAASGCKVLGVDIDERVVSSLNRGEVHIEEPGLQTVVSAAVMSGNLRVSTKPERADVFVIAVPTPILNDKRADMAYVRAATESILPVLQRGNLVILESTSPPCTTKEILCPILEKSGLKPGEDLYVAYCPERILPGKVLHELVHNDRIIGGINAKSAELAKAVYKKFVNATLHVTDATTAELVKLFENTSRDINIALANEFAKIAEAAGCNGHEAIRLANQHPRVNILEPGPGVGGHCIALDPWFLVERYPTISRLTRDAREINDGMVDYLIEKLTALGISKGQKVAILGVAYKPDIDDPRESPSERLAEKLDHMGIKIAVHDPLVKRFHFPLVPLEEALAGADAAILAVHHSAYKTLLAPAFIKSTMKQPLFIDARNFVDKKSFTDAGIRVYTLGVGGDL